MAVNVKNIIVGAGNLYISMSDGVQALPTAPTGVATWTSTMDAASATWRHVGATSGGVEVAYTPDTTDIEVDQLKDAALVFNSGQNMTVGTTLAEATLVNILLAWGYRSTDLVGGTTLNLPSAPDGLIERSLVIIGNAPAATGRAERVYYGRRVVSVDGSTHTLSRTEMVGIPVSFRLLPDTAAGSKGSEYGMIIDRAVT